MSTPKSVVKYKKDGIVFTDSVDKSIYTIKELSRAALRDVGKFVGREFKSNFYSHFNKITGKAPKSYKYKVYSSEGTKYPRVDLGIPHSQKGRVVPGFYTYFQEVGSSKQPKLGLIQKSVNENIETIIKIESQYLSYLEDEAKALSEINEKDYEGGGEDNDN